MMSLRSSSRLAIVCCALLATAPLRAETKDSDTAGLAPASCAMIPGLHAQYFADRIWKQPVLQRVDKCLDFDWTKESVVPEHGTRDFSVRWHGRLKPDVDGLHTFFMTGAEGCRLRIQGVLLIDAIDDPGTTRKTKPLSAEFPLTAGKSVELTVEYFGRVGQGAARLHWESAGRPRCIIPAENLWHQPPPPLPGRLSEPLPIWGADPAPVVSSDGRLFIYPTDSGPRAKSEGLNNWFVYSSNDLATWDDHGKAIGVADLTGWKIGGQLAIAPGAIYRNGNYFLYYYCHLKSETKGKAKGNVVRVVGVASSPNGRPPFVHHSVQGPLVTNMHDPGVFVDDDGQGYLFDGGHYYTLNPDMVSLAGGPTSFLFDKDNKHNGEASFIFKRGSLYYMLLGDHRRSPGRGVLKDFANNEETIVYHIAPSFQGPWSYGGVIMNPVYGQSRHGSVFFHQGAWLLSYHIWSEGNMSARRPALAELWFNADGSIVPVQPIAAGQYIK